MTSTVTDRVGLGDDLHSVVLNISSYATGGESITNAILGLPYDSDPFMVSCVRRGNAVAPLFASHDTTNNKVILHDAAGELAAAQAAIVVLTFRQPFK